MPRKKKSLNDIVSQAERIKAYPQYQAAQERGEITPIMGRAYAAFNRYYNNMVNSKTYRRSIEKAMAKNPRGDYWTPLNNLKISQRDYMGLAAG